MALITLAGSDAAFECAADDTILRAGLRAGLALPYECNVGCCGTCKIELVSGTVDDVWPLAPGLTEKDRSRGRRLACQCRPRSDCVIKAKEREVYRPLHRPQRFGATLVETLAVTHDIREFHFRAAAPARFLAGQYALLRLADGEGLRAYSMCNIANEAGEWHFQIKRVPTGAVSTALFAHLPIGARIEIDGPYGMAYLRPDAPRDIVCVAGGSGLSPVVSIARAYASEPRLAARKLHFFYGGRGPADICGESILRELVGWGERISYHPVISMPELDPAGIWGGKTGLVHDAVEATLGDSLRDCEIYFAGPPVMAQAVQMMLHRQKVPPAQIHFDQFY